MERTMTTVPERDLITVPDAQGAGRPRIRWGAVLSGMVVAVALLMSLVALWLALAYASNVDVIRDNLRWYVAGSAVGCLLIGGFMAGRLSGVPGAAAGLAHGLTLWAIALVISLSVGIPSVINILNLGRVTTELNNATGLIASGVDNSLWATFLSIVGAMVAAALGGIIGGVSLRGSRTVATNGGLSRNERMVTRPDDDRGL